ncbi:MAG: acyl-CoA thioesterase [Thiohalocapsa sp.]
MNTSTDISRHCSDRPGSRSIDDFEHWQLALRVLTMPADTNPYGDIFGGWLLSQADVAGATIAIARSRGRVATAAVQEFQFLAPLRVGDLVELHARLLQEGSSSMTVEVDIRARREAKPEDEHQVAKGRFVYVAVGTDGRKRTIHDEHTRLT